jgi:hypothetical protein
VRAPGWWGISATLENGGVEFVSLARGETGFVQRLHELGPFSMLSMRPASSFRFDRRMSRSETWIGCVTRSANMLPIHPMDEALEMGRKFQGTKEGQSASLRPRAAAKREARRGKDARDVRRVRFKLPPAAASSGRQPGSVQSSLAPSMLGNSPAAPVLGGGAPTRRGLDPVPICASGAPHRGSRLMLR